MGNKDKACHHCGLPVFSAGGVENQGTLGWLHLGTGDRNCAPPPAKHATPKRMVPQVIKNVWC